MGLEWDTLWCEIQTIYLRVSHGIETQQRVFRLQMYVQAKREKVLCQSKRQALKLPTKLSYFDCCELEADSKSSGVTGWCKACATLNQWKERTKASSCEGRLSWFQKVILWNFAFISQEFEISSDWSGAFLFPRLFLPMTKQEDFAVSQPRIALRKGNSGALQLPSPEVSFLYLQAIYFNPGGFGFEVVWNRGRSIILDAAGELMDLTR